MSASWVVVYKTINVAHADFVKAILENHEIEVIFINKKDSMNLHLINANIELHVSPLNVINAKFIISKTKFE